MAGASTSFGDEPFFKLHANEFPHKKAVRKKLISWYFAF